MISINGCRPVTATVENSSYDDLGGSPMEGAMKKLLIASGTLVALIAGGPAMAADSGVGAPPAYAPVNDWSGFYVGGHAGYGWGHDPFTSSLGSQQGGIRGFQSVNIPPVTLTGIDPKELRWGRPFWLQSTMGQLGRRTGSRHFWHRHEGLDGEHVDRLDFELADSL
jgi:hypothetical protein